MKNMKRCILPVLILAALGACQDENEIQYSVNPELQPYVDVFYSEAAARGAVIPKNLVADFKQEIQGITKGDKIQGQNYLYVRPELFTGFTDGEREAQIVYRMANIFLLTPEPGLDALTSPYDREATFNALFP